MTTAVDRFVAAMHVLVGDGHVKQRLTKAYQDHLDNLDADELPAPLQGTFASLQARLHSTTPANTEGEICASVRKMSPREAGECAESLLAIYAELIRRGDGRQPDLPLGRDPIGNEAEFVPPFLKSVN